MATDIDYDAEGCARFNVINYGNNLGRIELSVPGEHNVLNALSAIALASSYDISFEDIKKGIKKYKGASRRLEYKGKFKGACVYDDYGHHPTEIMATSNAIHKKQYNDLGLYSKLIHILELTNIKMILPKHLKILIILLLLIYMRLEKKMFMVLRKMIL